MREEIAAQVGEHALADPGREVGLRDRRDPAEQRRRDEQAPSRRSARGGRRGRCRGRSRTSRRTARRVRWPCRASSVKAERIALARYGAHEREQPAEAVERAPPRERGALGGERADGVVADAHETASAGASSSSDTKVRLDEAVAPDLGVDGVRVDELVVAAARRDAPVLEHDDLVGQRDGGEAVRDDDRRAALHDGLERAPDARLGGRVDRGGGVVEDQDARVGEQRARDREPLPLAARERQPALADERVVAARERLDEVVRLRLARRLDDVLARRAAACRRRCWRPRSSRTGTCPRRRSRSLRAGRRAAGRARRRRRARRGPPAGRRSAGSARRAWSCPSPCGRSGRSSCRERPRDRDRAARGGRRRSRTSRPRTAARRGRPGARRERAGR